MSVASRPDHPPGQAIRVALEHGYDAGRVGAWVVDLPGAFAWGPDRGVALARVPSAVGAFAAWLASHGEPIAVPETDHIEVVEELDATVDPASGGRTEKNVLLTADRRQATPDEVERSLRWLGHAREDLLRLVDAVRRREEAGMALPAAPEDRGPAPWDEVVRHVAGAEVWIAGRLDADARYEGPLRSGELDAVLAGTRAWAIDTIRALAHAAVEPRERAGETWTLPKVLRRLVYHSLDHLSELDRRLATAEGAADRLVYRRDALIHPDHVAPLFRSVGWYRLVRDPARLARLLEGSTEMASAWEGAELVGFGRTISDQAAYGLISTVAVHPRWQGKGVARRLLRLLLDGNDGIRFSLSAVPGVASLYEAAGFVRDDAAMVRRRLR